MRDASLDEFLSSSAEGEDPAGPKPGNEADDGEAAGPEPDTEMEDEREPDAGPDPDANAEAATESSAETESDAETDAKDDGPSPVDDVEPARTTFAWSPDGATCAECDERVEERWEAKAGLVCVECKEW